MPIQCGRTRKRERVLALCPEVVVGPEHCSSTPVITDASVSSWERPLPTLGHANPEPRGEAVTAGREGHGC